MAIFWRLKVKYIKLFSLVYTLFLRLIGVKVGKKNLFYGSLNIRGYTNNIKIGNGCQFHNNVIIVSNENSNIIINDNVLVGDNCIINSMGRISIGSNTMIAANCYIIDNDHKYKDNTLFHKQGHVIEDVIIGENVWLGTGSTVLKGVLIGKNSVIGASSLVNRNIPSNSLCAGVPAKVKISSNGIDN
jgi:acetyltransferase-like isoleucine patch superfamily enzyme